jgi:hypothetical protein
VSGPVLEAGVLVCGGGVAGTMAAVAAARHGAQVVLAERYGFLGGNATAGAVAQFNSWQTASGRRVVAGLAQEVVDRLRRYEGAGEHHTFVMSTGHKMDRVEYAPEVLKLVLDDMLSEAGVQPLLHSMLLDVDVIPPPSLVIPAKAGIQQRADHHPLRSISSVRLLTKGGVLTVRPRVVIDTSGDMDALRLAGARFLSLDEGEALQPATMMFRFGPIDFARFDALSKDDLAKLSRRGYEEGALARAALHLARDPFTNDGWFNISRLGIDATDPLALGKAEIEGRRQAWEAAQFLRAQVPGCEGGRLLAFGTQVGVRETRRVEGDHVLTAQDLLQPMLFDDAIAAGAYPIDIHPAAGGGLDYKPLGEDHAYCIPYRSIVPAGLANVLAAGRGVSATHQALAAIRVMTISMAVGQAAGSAAAMAAREHDGDVRKVAAASLRAALLADGAILR